MNERIIILLVDDDEHLRETVAALLTDPTSSPSYDVMHAADGRAALVLARSRRPHVIVTDLEMPVLDGAEFVRRLQADPELASLPVILISGSSNLRATAEQVGVRGFLDKPYDIGELRREIVRVTGEDPAVEGAPSPDDD